MLLNINHLYRRKLGAQDGDIGHVKDFYFDDQSWAIRYVVADTGTWLSERQVLLSPLAFGIHAFGRSDSNANTLLVSLTRKQVEDSPSIDQHQPVSRQYEADYYRFYGWPVYWEGGGVWGASSLPILTPPLSEAKPASNQTAQQVDSHLRSTKSLVGYQIHTPTGAIGTVASFMLDGSSWSIRELVIETGHWYSEKTIRILPGNITRISYEDSTIFVDLSREDIAQTVRNELAAKRPYTTEKT